jgi:hypothetical protein
MTRDRNPESNPYETRIEAEETLRLLAELPSPENLADRVHASVRTQMALDRVAPARRGFWALWSPGRRLQFAGVGVLAVAVAGSMWTINRSHQAGVSQQTPQVAAPLQPVSDSGFSGAKAARVPNTLNPIKVPAVPKKKPSPKGVVKPASRSTQNSPATKGIPGQPEQP